MNTADKIDSQNGEYTGGHSPLYGHGRINAQRATTLVAGEGGEDKPPQVLFVEHRINRSIPDFSEMDDVISFPFDVNAQELEVNLKIGHTWRGDLRVILIPPQSGEITLVDRTGGNQDDLIRSYRSSDDPELFSSAIGKSARGEWRLKVLDMARQDVGVLVKWGLAVTYS